MHNQPDSVRPFPVTLSRAFRIGMLRLSFVVRVIGLKIALFLPTVRGYSRHSPTSLKRWSLGRRMSDIRAPEMNSQVVSQYIAIIYVAGFNSILYLNRIHLTYIKTYKHLLIW